MSYEHSLRDGKVAGGQLQSELVTLILGGMCLLHLVIWVPNYLIWPWAPDHDMWGTVALSWDAGVVPYREFYVNNLPGTMYIYWLLGKLCGWGRTTPFFVMDAMLVVALGAMMIAWSIRRFGQMLPALVGYLVFLYYYCSLNYTMAGERDWHCTLLAVVGIMAADAWPGRGGRYASALVTALGASIRPQMVFFFPALALAVDSSAREPGKSWGPRIRAWAEWAVVFGLVTVLLYVPLLRDGLIGELIRSVRRGGIGGRTDPMSVALVISRTLRILSRLEVLATLISVAALAQYEGSSPSMRRLARVMLVMLVAAIVYKPLSPRQHDYLDVPRFLAIAMALSTVVGIVVRLDGIPWVVRLVTACLAIGTGASPRWMQPYWNIDSVAPALREMERAPNDPPRFIPPGYAGLYDLRDYYGLLAYLRAQIDPRLRIANMMIYPIAITGPIGRLSAFPAESLAWLNGVRPDDEGVFADQLERTPDSVVIWWPEEFAGSAYRRLEVVIRNRYEPDAEFGIFQVWRRKTTSSR
jgi:hypothetical protein